MYMEIPPEKSRFRIYKYNHFFQLRLGFFATIPNIYIPSYFFHYRPHLKLIMTLFIVVQ